MIGRIEHAYHRRIEEVLSGGSLTGSADGELLERFASGSPGESEVAFAMLVERHGPMVLRVCRGVLRDAHDAEDAFQATFLVLVRRARSIRKAGSLGPWLHGVALRVAACQRSSQASRRARERRWAGDRPGEDEPVEAERRDALRAIQEEIGRLPDRYRSPIVLCDLEALPLDAAARQLGWPSGTVKSRLHRARRRLRDRLIRRGLAPAVAGSVLGTIAGPADATMTMTAELAEQALLGALAASTRATQAGAAARVAELAARAGRSLLMDRLKASSMGFAALLTLGVGAAAMAGRLQGQGPGNPAAAEAPAPTAKAMRPPPPAIAKAAERPASRDPSREGRRTIPLTIAGRAVDESGKPVANADIYITNCNPSRAMKELDLLATGKTDGSGRFAIRDVPLPVLLPPPGPLPSAEEGRFQVAGTAPGFGFTWDQIRGFRPGPRPATAEKGDRTASTAIYEGEPIQVDLTFGPSASLRGRITDDAGRPLAGVPVEVGYIRETKTPGSLGLWRCNRVDATDGAIPHEARSFNGIGHLPASLRSATTGPDGTYHIDDLPREAELLAEIDPGPEFEPFVGMIATTTRPIDGSLSLGHDAVLDHAFTAPAEVRFRVVRAGSSQPARGATVRAQTDETMLRGGSVGETNDQGEAVLYLRPGDYQFLVDPAFGAPDLPARGSFRVEPRKSRQESQVVLAPAAAVVVRAVDAATGDGVEGVSVDYEAETNRERKELRSRPGAMDHPVTDPGGLLRAVLEPGRYRLATAEIPRGWKLRARPPGQAGSAVNRFAALAPGAEVEVRFELEESGGSEAARDQRPDVIPIAIWDQWSRQRRLVRVGFFRMRQYIGLGTAASATKLEAFLDSADLALDANPAATLRAMLPDLGIGEEKAYEIIDDGRLQRNVYWFNGDKSKPHVAVYNGREVIASGSNPQVDIYDARQNGVLAVLGGRSIAQWPHPSLFQGNGATASSWSVTRDEKADGRLTIAREDHKLVVDSHTGFAYVDSWKDRTSGQVRTVRQYGPQTLPGGAVVPRGIVELRHHGDTVESCWLTLIDEANTTYRPRPEDFTVPAPAGIQIIDHREDPQNPRMGTCHYPVADVLAYADRFTSRSQLLEKVLKPGDDAPEIRPVSWLTRDGKTGPPELRGEVVLIDFWGITCGPCVAEMPEVQAAADHFADRSKDMILIGVHESGVPEGQVAEFARKRGLSFTMALDRPAEAEGWFGATFKDYGIRAIPAAAVLDRRGKVAYVGRFAEALAKAAKLIDEP